MTGVQTCALPISHNKKIACVVDVRNGENFQQLLPTIKELRKTGTAQIIYLDAGDKVLMDRYKETRRKHPFMQYKDISLSQAINYERKVLSPLYNQADFILDTSLFSTSQLKDRILSYVVKDTRQTMSIDVISFGFKYGVPSDVDTVFDVRCLTNPFYIPHLKNLTGMDEEVEKFVFSQENAKKLLKMHCDLIDFCLPLYVQEGKSHFTIAYGCTGGKHRSVAFANALYNYIKDRGYHVSVHHRDINRGKSWVN